MTSWILYRADRAWQRTGESLLATRYYWWCVQCATFVVLPTAYQQGGTRAVVYCLQHAVDWRYVYESRHSWDTVADPVSAVELVMMLRQEHKERERALFLESFDGPVMSDSGFNRIVKATPLHPFTDRDVNPWPTVRERASVVYPVEPETALLVPFEWWNPAREEINA